MEKTLSLEKKASLYAGVKLRELRGDEARVAFGERIGVKEALLYKYEKGKTNIGIGTLARLAKRLGLPLSTFILPDSDDAFGEAEEESEDERKKVA